MKNIVVNARTPLIIKCIFNHARSYSSGKQFLDTVSWFQYDEPKFRQRFTIVVTEHEEKQGDVAEAPPFHGCMIPETVS
jgi:hypothetical protein